MVFCLVQQCRWAYLPVWGAEAHYFDAAPCYFRDGGAAAHVGTSALYLPALCPHLAVAAHFACELKCEGQKLSLTFEYPV